MPTGNLPLDACRRVRELRARIRPVPLHAHLRTLAATLALVLAVAACTSAGTAGGSAGATPAVTPAQSAAAGCDTGTFPGWPKPGQVTTSGIIPVLASSEKLAGQSRLLFALVDDKNRPIADETLEVEIGFFDLCADPASATEVLTPTFEWGIVGQHAFYVVTPDLAQPGPWGAAIAVRDPATGTTTAAKLQFTVSSGGYGPRVGDPAPAVKTLTLADVGGDVRKVSTDPSPDPSFYETSLDAALAAREPFILAFVTPGFCKSAQCGPTFEVVKAAVKTAPIRVVAVEPYKLTYQGGRLQPVLENDDFVPVEAADVYGIPTEPWIFVVGADGVITSSFEAVVGQQELVDAIRAVTK
jgi:hypothetical protein